MKYLISIKRLLPSGTLCFLQGLAISLLISLPALAQPASATVTYFHNDISGSPMLATDAAGNQVWKESYRPYGQKLRDEPASRDGKNKIGYAGSPFDASTGLSYMGARYYDPVIGRFMGVDPVGFQEGNVHSFNRYAYANNNPYKYIDRNGKYAELAIEAVSLTVGFKSLLNNLGARNYRAAAVDGLGIAADVFGAAIPGAPGIAGLGIKASREAAELGVKSAATAAKASDDAIQVTSSGVAILPSAKHQIPKEYAQNPYRSGSYGEIVEGKFKEKLRIDPPTPAGQKGPNHSHYHLDGKGAHYSPRTGDKDPGF